MADINSYALGLELQLQIDPALKALDKVSVAIKDVQQALSKAAATFEVGTAATGVEKKMVAGWESVRSELDLIHVGMQKAYGNIEAASKKFGDSLFVSNEELEKQNKIIEKNTRRYHELENQYLKILDKFAKHEGALEKQEKQYEKLDQNMLDMQAHITKSNKGFTDQHDILGKLIGSLGLFGESSNIVIQVATALTSRFGLLTAASILLGNAIREIVEMQDTYAKANFRALGSIDDLIEASTSLRITTAATAKESINTFRALGAAGIQAGKGLSRLAEDNFKFSFATGVSQDVTAQYQKVLMITGSSADGAGKKLGELAGVISKTGMSAREAEQLMGGLNHTLLILSTQMNPEQVDDYTKTITQLSGALRVAASPEAAAEITSFFNTISKDTISHAGQWRILAGQFSSTKTASELLHDALNNMGPTLDRLQGSNKQLTTAMAKQMGLPESFAAGYNALIKEATKAGLTVTEYIAKTKPALTLNEQFAKSMETLTGEFRKIIQPILAWITHFITAHPILTKTFIILGSGILIAGLVAFAFNNIAKSVMTFTKSAITAVRWAGDLGKKVLNLGTAAKTTDKATGMGLKTFMQEVAEGLKAFADPKALLGLFAIGLFVTLMTGVVVGVAIAIKEFGLSAEDLTKAAFAMLIGVGVMGIAIGLLSLVGMEAIAASELLWPLAAVMIALGAAVALAGFGIKMAGDALEKLFKVVLDHAGEFVLVLGALILALPAVSFGLGLFAASLAFTAPIILFGMGELAGAALLGLLVVPFMTKMASALSLIGTAMTNIGPRSGVALISLATGMLAFMAALTGTAAVGAITSFFGLTKDPLVQAKKIADAITMISSPAVALASALLKVKNVGDAFKPIDGILGKKEELNEAISTLERLNNRILAMDKTIKETGFTIPTAEATPIRQPAITDDTARRINDRRSQSEMIDSTKGMKASLDKIGDKLTPNSNMKDLIDLLRVWLPKIAQTDKDEGLGSSVNQWM